MALSSYRRTLRGRRRRVAVLLALLVLSAGLSVLIGPAGWSDIAARREILVSVRLPRIALALLTGAALAAAGTCLQGLFRNRLASPYVLGVSGATAFGACLGLLAGLPPIPAAFLMGLATAGVLWRVSARLGTESLILVGVALGALFSSLLALAIYVSGEKLAEIVFWLMGGFWLAGWRQVAHVGLWVGVALGFLPFLLKPLNLVATGEEAALDLGVDVPRLRALVLVVSAVLVAAPVSASGTIGFVGLAVPNLMRLWIGPDHRFLLPASVLGGAVLLLWADNLSRVALYAGEIPVGIFTSFLGVPFFIYLIAARAR
jgi:iron complex transport system permease protein